MSVPILPTSFEHAAPRLRVRLYGAVPHALRTKEFQALGAAAGLPAVRALAGELLAGVVLDLEQGAVPVSAQMLHQWGSDLPAALQAATANVHGAQPDGVTQIAAGGYVITDEAFAGAVLLDPAAAATIPVRGPLVVVAPANGVIVVAGADDPISLAAMAGALEQSARTGSDLLSPVPVVQSPSGWATFAWPADSLLYPVLARSYRRFYSAWYARQAPLLDGDAYVAAANAYERDGDVVLVAAWTRGVETLLPVTDEVVIVGETGVVGTMTYGEFAARPGVTSTDHLPMRLHVAASTQA